MSEQQNREEQSSFWLDRWNEIKESDAFVPALISFTLIFLFFILAGVIYTLSTNWLVATIGVLLAIGGIASGFIFFVALISIFEDAF